MPDTGLPWEIPYVDPTDLVRDYPQASEDLADAIAAGLTLASAGVVVAVKFAIEDTPTSQSTATQGFLTGVSLSHTAADATNLIYCIGQVTGSADANNFVAVAFRVDGTVANAPASPGSRTPIMGQNVHRATNELMSSVTGVGQVVAGDTSSHTYSFDLCNVDTVTRTLFRNRSVDDTNSVSRARGVCTMMLIEVEP
jgi:hypothetical protein